MRGDRNETYAASPREIGKLIEIGCWKMRDKALFLQKVSTSFHEFQRVSISSNLVSRREAAKSFTFHEIEREFDLCKINEESS